MHEDEKGTFPQKGCRTNETLVCCPAHRCPAAGRLCPGWEGLSSAPAETVTGFRWGGEEDTLHQFADHDGSINGYRDYTITACFSADGEASPPVPLTMEQIGSQFFTDLQERVPQPPPKS